jgi:hypothetical protein
MKCILNVNEREYDKILQLNHDAVMWKTTDRELLRSLEKLIGPEAVADMVGFEECKMQKQTEPGCHPRIEPDDSVVETPALTGDR